MTFQIRAIAVYAASGEPRVVSLRTGAVNVITGASKTGKSTLLDIIDYCMGSSDFPVARGVVPAHVVAYAVLFQKGNEGVLVARLAPRDGASVSTQFHLRSMSPDSLLPPVEALEVNADVDTAKSALAAFAGISENLHEPATGTRAPLRATIRHTLFYCLQGQDEIASRSVLFHSQANEWTPQAMRDVMPFFLGAVPDDHMAKLNRMRQLRRDLKQLRRGAAERDALRGPSGRELALLGEAVEVGLIEADAWQMENRPIAMLGSAMSAPEPQVQLPGPSSFGKLSGERRILRDEFSRVRASLANLLVIRAERSEFEVEAAEQRSRLSLADMFATSTREATCPVCATDLSEATSDVEGLREELAALESDIASISTTTPELGALISQAEGRLAELETLIRNNKSALDEAERSSQILAQYQDLALRRAAVRGRISMFLSARPDAIVDETLDARIAELEAQINALEGDLDSDEAAARLASALSRVNANISEIARALKLEHAESPARLDIRGLTVFADTLGGPVALDQMGSGENWVGYHLSTMLGLHRYFIEAERPVPRFLAIDQPSQVYFPPDVDHAEVDDDDDREALERMMRVIQTEVERHGGDLQVLVVDHADIAADWFQDAVVEKWRGGKALVPSEWIACDTD